MSLSDYERARPYTMKLWDMVNDGILDSMSVMEMALNWLSESDVKQMMEANDLIEDEEEEVCCPDCGASLEDCMPKEDGSIQCPMCGLVLDDGSDEYFEDIDIEKGGT